MTQWVKVLSIMLGDPLLKPETRWMERTNFDRLASDLLVYTMAQTCLHTYMNGCTIHNKYFLKP